MRMLGNGPNDRDTLGRRNGVVAEHDQIETGVDRLPHPGAVGRFVEEEAGRHAHGVGDRGGHGRVRRQRIARDAVTDAAGRCR